MAYIFKQKLQIQDLVDIERTTKKVLIHEPEEYLSALYSHYLKAHNFDVKHCPNFEILKQFTRNFTPDVLVFNIDNLHNEKVAGAWLYDFREAFPGIAVVTIGFSDNHEVLKKLMSAGISSHINRKLSRPQDLVVIVKNILQV